jgi:hypothetical protein
MRRYKETKEEKIAKLILDKISDLTINLELIGYYIALNVSGVLYNRFQIISETAEEEKEKRNGNNIQK